MARRVVTRVVRDSDGDIKFICNWGQPWSPRSTEEAIRDITSGDHTYVVEHRDYEPTAIHVVRGPSRSYLRTSLDESESNNLDLLPDGIPEFVGDYPADDSTDWTYLLQGVTHSADHWFLSQKTWIWKFHVSTDLRSDLSARAGEARMPAELWDIGCSHFGDPEYVVSNGAGYVLVPVEGEEWGDCKTQPRLAVFIDSDDQLTYLGSSLFEAQVTGSGRGHAGWCAVDPIDGLVYTSGAEVNDESLVHRYRLDHGLLESGVVRLEWHSDLTLRHGGAAVEIPRWMQGGCFSPAGHLYLCNGRTGDDEREGGIRVFDRQGQMIYRSSNRSRPFLYEYHSGWGPTRPWSEEPEGITYWDLDDATAPGISGQLHAILLNKDPLTDDTIYFKHFNA